MDNKALFDLLNSTVFSLICGRFQEMFWNKSNENSSDSKWMKFNKYSYNKINHTLMVEN